MPTQARTPADHYAEALRLLDVGKSEVGTTDPTPALQRIRAEALAEATVHAVLALAPRSARRRRRDHDSPTMASPKHRWLYGTDEDGER
jgi:hypothetical protein